MEAIRWEIISFWMQVLILQKKDTVNIQNQDSSLVNSNDSIHNLIALENSYYESNSIKQFFQKRSAERLERRPQRKEKLLNSSYFPPA